MTLDFLTVLGLEDQAIETEPIVHWDALEERLTRGVRVIGDAEQAQVLAAVVGLDYVGLSNAMALRRAGVRTVGIETSPSRLRDIRSGRAGLPGAQGEELRGARDDADFVLTDTVEAIDTADLVLICVPTTLDRQRRPNLDALRRACASVAQYARAGQTLVLSSTAYVGSTRELLAEPLAQRGLRVGEDVFVACSPPRVEPGVPDRGLQQPPLVVGGVTEACLRRASELLGHICSEVHAVSSLEAAEMVKLYEGAFRAVNVAFAFEMADACRTQGVDAVEIAEAAATRPPGQIEHCPSAGIAAHRVGVDPRYLLHPLTERGRTAKLTEEAVRQVDARPRRLAMRAHELLLRSARDLRDARVLVVGASSEPGVAEGRDAPAVEIIERLQTAGVQVDFHDPRVPVLFIDGEEMYGVDPDPRRDASGFGPEDYDLAILLARRPGHNYGWLRRCPQVLDCTYREHTGRRRFLP